MSENNSRSALSPRTPAPRLVSTSVLEGSAPRQAQSPLQRRALIAGMTVKAGPVTESRLQRGGIIHVVWRPREV